METQIASLSPRNYFRGEFLFKFHGGEPPYPSVEFSRGTEFARNNKVTARVLRAMRQMRLFVRRAFVPLATLPVTGFPRIKIEHRPIIAFGFASFLSFRLVHVAPTISPLVCVIVAPVLVTRRTVLRSKKLQAIFKMQFDYPFFVIM